MLCLFPLWANPMDLLLQYDDYPDQELPIQDQPAGQNAMAAAFALLTRDCPSDADPGDIIEADTILRNDVYLRTNPLVKRSILDYPAFYYPFCRPETWSLIGQLWVNQTPRMAFYNDAFALRDYLAFDNKNLISQIDTLASLVVGLNIPKILSLLGDIEIEDRRAALMFWFQRQKGKWLIQWKTPLAYIERNFQLDEQEKAQLEQEVSGFFNTGNDIPAEVASLSGTQNEEFEAFKKQHLISDKFGLGDSRFTAGYTFVDNDSLWVNAGFLATIPTAFAFSKGVWKGSHFPKNSDHPPFDLAEILLLALGDDAERAQAQQLTINFLLGALDKLSANLLDDNIGNGGHVGLGFVYDSKLQVTPRFSFDTHAEFEYLLPVMEKRFYINAKDQAGFNAVAQNPADCPNDLNFIQEQLIQILYPRVYNTMVFPGVLIKFSTAADIWIAEQSTLNLGYDLWWQQQEKLGRIIASSQNQALARKDIATKPSAFQSKLFGAYTYNHPGKCGDWCISLTADYTFLSAGIGKDYSASFRLEYLF
ncbi:hypothetical protein HYX58_00245 [Candidatus Dependentiae bacterium]|nr:hypothetical protein [Candidatus Dependentiae bacterium]